VLPAAAEVPFVPPVARELALDNGIRVIVIENHRLPLVAIETVHAGAGSRDDGAKPGLAALAADLLDDGAGSLDAEQFTAELEALGATLEVNIASDYATVSMTALGNRLEASLHLLADAIRRPRFADADVARVRDARTADLALVRDRPAVACAQLFDRIVFGEHPYAHPAVGTAASMAAITAADVRGFWKRAYGPATTTIVIAGDVSPTEITIKLASAFGDWSNPIPAPPRTPLVVGPTAPQLAYIDRPGAQLAAIMVGRRGYAAGDPRQTAADIANTALGSGAGARLTARLRDQLGYTHGIGSGFWRGRWGGTWSVASSVRTATTGDALKEIVHAIDAIRTTELPPDEVAHARSLIVRSLPQAFETDAQTARAFARLISHGEPLDAYPTYLAELAAVTPATARAAIAPVTTELVVVIVGDWTAIEPQVQSLGLPIHRYEP
jgi:zinc protease